MDRNAFWTDCAEGLDALVRVSCEAGARTDYVQGGGGNTSAKLDGARMAVKASGFRLGQVTREDAYAVLDYQRLRAFFRDPGNRSLSDPEPAGRAAVQAAGISIEGLPARRPSVEAGFHALLGTFVLHTHSVYANAVCCSDDPAGLAAEAMDPLGLPWGIVPYIDPGTRLTFAVAEEAEQIRKRFGTEPAVLLFQNHGLAVSAPDAASCLELHERVNLRLMERMGIGRDDWPHPAVCLAEEGGGYRSATPWLGARIAGLQNPVSFFTGNPLYPDQMVYLEGKLAVAGGETPGTVCHIDPRSGGIRYACGETEASAIEETLCAVLFIHEVLRRNGRAPRAMDAAARSFIAGWESEAYRRRITAGTPDEGTEETPI